MSSQNFFKIKTKNYKSCFVYLKPRIGFESGAPVQLVGEDDVYYFSVVFTEGLDEDSIGMSSLYAKTLGFTEGHLVVVSPIQLLPVVNRITIRPYTQADYEVLELLAQNVQSNLLDQVRVVRTGQKLCIWLGNNLFVTVMVESVQPVTLGTLDFLTEVVIDPPSNKTTPEDHPRRSEFDEALNLIKSWKNTSLNPTSTKTVDEFVHPLKLSLRLVPLSKLPNPPSCVHQFTVFANQNCLSDLLHDSFYQMTLLDQTSDKIIYVKLKLLDNQNCDEIFVHDSIFNYFKTHIGARVVLEKITTKPLVEHVLIEGKGPDLVVKVKKYLADNCTEPYILNGKFPLMLPDKSLCSLEFGSSKFCIVDQALLRRLSYSSNDVLISLIDESEDLNYEDLGQLCFEVHNIKQVRVDILTVLLKGGAFKGDNVILTGNLGTGKTSLLRYVASTLHSYPHFLHTETVKCKSLKGKTVESLQKFFSDIFSTLILAQPSLLILDDLHIICEANEGEDNPNSIYHSRASEMLYRLFKVVQDVHCVGILASTVAISKLNSRVYRSRGRYLFNHVISIQDLSKDDRVLLLKHYFKTPKLDYDALALKTDGFVVQDLENLYVKALFEAYKNCTNQLDEPIINNEHCSEALKKTCSLSLQNVQFHSPGDKSFSDVGGLDSVKSALLESLLWPLKYANIFANSPLRLQSGILLYGPPGTGKTLLACAAAKHCSLRLISVKGPELLSKYIGASEQAVRDIFEKAQKAKPCILFFDEFDSLAPRRGHDSTGVTDRVVNQLLTQLDGVESLKGVCVLAATSRPDLLDPALLRPGRLDKQLLCSMPDKNARLEILNIMSRKLNLGDNVDLELVASKTDGYSGADLHSVLCTAQLSTMKNVLQGETITVERPQIDQICLLDALNQTRPSLTRREKEKYDIIYHKFQGGQLDDFKTGSKVTLA